MCTGDAGARRRAQRNPEALSKLHWSFLTMRRKRANFEQGNEQLMTSEKIHMSPCLAVRALGATDLCRRAGSVWQPASSNHPIWRFKKPMTSALRHHDIFVVTSQSETPKTYFYCGERSFIETRAPNTGYCDGDSRLCQGISLANHKKNIGDFERNPLWLMRL